MFFEMFELSREFSWWAPAVMGVGILLIVGLWRWAVATSRTEAAEVKS